MISHETHKYQNGLPKKSNNKVTARDGVWLLN